MVRAPVYVKDVMNPHVIKIDIKNTVQQAENIMKNQGIPRIIVTVGNQPKYVLEDWQLFGIKDKQMTISQLATRTELQEVGTAGSDEILQKVLPKFEKTSVLVILDKNNQVSGVLTAFDIYAKKQSQ